MLTRVTNVLRNSLSDSSLTVVRALLVLLTVIVLVWQISGLLQKPKVSLTTPSVQRSFQYDLAAIKQANLFGKASVTRLSQNADNLPLSSLQLSLAGVFTSLTPSKAGAIIESPAQGARYYKVNQGLPGGARLLEVRHDRVIIERAGIREALIFPDSDSETEAINEIAKTGSIETSDQVQNMINLKNLSEEDRKEAIRQRLEQLRNRSRN